jgi:phosphoribosylformimino-5-aminoimidazole carboxamide ribotide isomerase
MKIIPAIDIIDGKCVRLTQGDFKKKKIYSEDPLDVALQFQNADLEYLHLVDLDGAKEGEVVNWDVIYELQEKTALQIDFGGGVKTDEDVEQLINLDIYQINIGSVAINEPEKFKRWMNEFGSRNFALSADVKGEHLMINGWLEPTELRLFDLVEDYMHSGLEYVTCTDIGSDGMLDGPNFDLYEKLIKRFPTLKITASGGISSLEDLRKLKAMGLYGVIIGKALYEHKIELADLRPFTLK